MLNFRAVRIAGIAAVAAAFVAGCGSDSDSGTASNVATAAAGATTSTAAAAGNGADAVVAEAQAVIDKGFSGSLSSDPPATGPPAQKGKTVWVVNCGQAAPGCATPAAAIQDAAKTLDWKVRVVDGKLNPAGYAAGIRQAIAAKVDGIITVAIDCPLIKAPLEAARAAKIPVVAVYAYDCDTPSVGGKPLFAALANNGGSPHDFFTEWGKVRADYTIASTKGKATVIDMVQPDFIGLVDVDEAYKAELKKCSGCKIVATLEVPATDLVGTKAAQKLSTVLQQHPEANVVQVPSDSLMQLVGQSLRAANRPDLKAIGGEGYQANLELIRSGVQTVAVAPPAAWFGWGGADAMNRVFAGQTDIPPSGSGLTLIDKDHNLPPSGQDWKVPVDFEAGFKKVWTGG